jgi:chemotaxis protein CheZ
MTNPQQDTKKIITELIQLKRAMAKAKSEIASIRDSHQSKHNISNAKDELDAILESTAQATQIILTSAEEIQNKLLAPPESEDKQLIKQITKIFEACTFQDLSRQRTAKVLEILSIIEEHLEKIMYIFCLESISDGNIDSQNKKKIEREKLKNGPQLIQPNQDAVDDIFSKS